MGERQRPARPLPRPQDRRNVLRPARGEARRRRVQGLLPGRARLAPDAGNEHAASGGRPCGIGACSARQAPGWEPGPWSDTCPRVDGQTAVDPERRPRRQGTRRGRSRCGRRCLPSDRVPSSWVPTPVEAAYGNLVTILGIHPSDGLGLARRIPVSDASEAIRRFLEADRGGRN